MDDNIERWAHWSWADGTKAGLRLGTMELGWFRTMMITCALIYVSPYASFLWARDIDNDC